MSIARIYALRPSVGATIGLFICLGMVVLDFLLLNVQGWTFEIFFTASIFGDMVAITAGLITMLRMANPLLLFATLLSWLTILGIFLTKAVVTVIQLVMVIFFSI